MFGTRFIRQLQRLPSHSQQNYKYFKRRNRLPFYQDNRFWMVVGGGGLAFGWYYTSHLETVPISGRRRFNDVSEAQERFLGDQAFKEVLREHQGRFLPSFHPSVASIRNVAARIGKAAGIDTVEIYVVNEPVRNAFCLPGGKVVVFTGIIPIAKDDNGMAAILAHEIAHQIAHHSSENIARSKLLMWTYIIVSHLFIDPGPFLGQLIMQLGILMPFSRMMESEADLIGIQIMAKACYDPEATIDMWRRMSAAEKDDIKPHEYVSTHPSNETRIAKLREWLPKARRIREDSDCHSFLDFRRSVWGS